MLSQFTVRDLAEVWLSHFAIRVIPCALDEVGAAMHAYAAFFFVIGRLSWTPVCVEHGPAVGPAIRPCVLVLQRTDSSAFTSQFSPGFDQCVKIPDALGHMTSTLPCPVCAVALMFGF